MVVSDHSQRALEGPILEFVAAHSYFHRLFDLRKDLETPDTFHDFLFTEAMESYKVYGRMEAIVLLGGASICIG